jgi:hypothetical protein
MEKSFMPQNELLADVLRRDIGFLQMMIADMSDAELAQRPVPTANTGLWQLGHLVKADANMVNACAGRTVVELPAGFADRYAKSTAGENDASKLGKKAELLALFEANRKKIADWVGTLSAADLAKPAPENMRSIIPTVGHVVHLLPGHLNMHVGQLQVLRRKLGKPVMF